MIPFMTNRLRSFGANFVIASILLISACSTTSDAPSVPSLGELDIKKDIKLKNTTKVKPKSDEEIRQAYSSYLDNASIDDNSRVNALNRLAELEFVYSNKLLKDQEKQKTDSADAEDRLYETRLDKTIQLLSTSLKDYPNAKNNDVIMYQLAKALDLKGRHEESIETLNNLVNEYPGSQFYLEVQFRLAEDAFSIQDYSTAEYSYTEVINSDGNDVFYEKSLFKRGWARFKQRYYTEAVDDFLAAVFRHKFDEFEKLNKTEREQFDEYFRAVGLAFSYMGGASPLYEYVKDQADFKYTYHTYSMLSNIYLKQERYSDAVDALRQFIKYFPNSDNIPYSKLKIIEIWQNSGFTNKIYGAIEDFYVNYNPSSLYWKNQNENSSVNRVIRRSLKKYIILMSGFYHNRYQKTASQSDYNKTELWYKRYLKDYSAYAQNDKIYFLYAELLNQHKKISEALKYYELAAYENDLIIHKDAAYASILLSDELIRKFPDNKDYLRKHIDYSLKYSVAYPDSKRSQQLIIHAAELAFNAGEYKHTIELADVRFAHTPLTSNLNLALLKSQSYFKLKEYEESEKLYEQIYKARGLTKAQQKKINDGLALSIYQQAKLAESEQQIPQAANHFARISNILPQSSIAATGLYDAIALNMRHKQWENAIKDIKKFQKFYPNHKLQSDVSKKLSVAYLSSDQGIEAAKQFEKISSSSQDKAIKSAALWQAAELYQKKKQYKDAIRAYESYAEKYKKPFDQYLEAMNELSNLTTKTGQLTASSRWKAKIVNADKKALNNVKTDRTKYIVSMSYLGLADNEKKRFEKLRLSLPLNKSLNLKKQAMQSAVKLYGKSSMYKNYEATTEATYSIADIYKSFSRSLLDSDRPKGLNDEQMDQYEILLEDKAFPFEDKAIEFFEINLSRIQQGQFNSWIEKSQQKLVELFPVRYNRKPKQDNYISEIR